MPLPGWVPEAVSRALARCLCCVMATEGTLSTEGPAVQGALCRGDDSFSVLAQLSACTTCFDDDFFTFRGCAFPPAPSRSALIPPSCLCLAENRHHCRLPGSSRLQQGEACMAGWEEGTSPSCFHYQGKAGGAGGQLCFSAWSLRLPVPGEQRWSRDG